MIYKRKAMQETAGQRRRPALAIWLCIGLALLAGCGWWQPAAAMPSAEIRRLRDEAKQLFYHGYDSYMQHAYPADELMPLSCRGRYRDSEPSRGDIDDALGNFSLTLIDTLDTLVLLGNLSEFESGVRKVSETVHFDSDIVVSVFETNIRMLGGLLSGHVFAEQLKGGHAPDYLDFYDGQLLRLAVDLANRLMPAFNTSTGIPYPRVNLRTGMNASSISSARDTCTACAGTMLLEFAALSRLTNDPTFERAARKAMDYLWQQRHRTSGLVGTVLNIHNGDWINRESGVGAGIDSYYEYLLKGYVLLGDGEYLARFNQHYAGVMKYVSQGPLLVNVHMHRPRVNTKNVMDSLLAFWPGLQVLKGDLLPAVQTHELLYQVMRKHDFLLPESFSVIDFSVQWAEFLVRPEFIESTYFLFKATGDHYYLEVGKELLQAIRKHTKTSCGFAAVRDVRTGVKDDRMDSFVLSETFKYLYLLFAEKRDLPVDLDDFVFTTEAHPLPLSLSSSGAKDSRKASLKTCPDIRLLHSDQSHNYFKKFHRKPATSRQDRRFFSRIRDKLKNYVPTDQSQQKQRSTAFGLDTFRFRQHGDADATCGDGACANRAGGVAGLDQDEPYEIIKLRLLPEQFSAYDQQHVGLLRQLGIRLGMLSDGRVQLMHDPARADSARDGQEGALFMQEMMRLSKAQQLQQDTPAPVLALVRLIDPVAGEEVRLQAGSSQFGADLLSNRSYSLTGWINQQRLPRACDTLPDEYRQQMRGRIALVERGDCMFVQKVRNVLALGAIGCIVIDDTAGSSGATSPLFSMSGDGGKSDDIVVPVVFLYRKEGDLLLKTLREHGSVQIRISSVHDESRFLPQPNDLPNAAQPDEERTAEPSEVPGAAVDALELLIGKLGKLLEVGSLSSTAELIDLVPTMLEKLSSLYPDGSLQQVRDLLNRDPRVLQRVLNALERLGDGLDSKVADRKLPEQTHPASRRALRGLQDRLLEELERCANVMTSRAQFVRHLTERLWICT